MSDDQFRPPTEDLGDHEVPNLHPDSFHESASTEVADLGFAPAATEDFSQFAADDAVVTDAHVHESARVVVSVDDSVDDSVDGGLVDAGPAAVVSNKSSYVRVRSARRRQRRRLAAILTAAFFLLWLGFGGTVWRGIYESKKEKEAKVALSANEFAGLKVRADGRNLILSGTATTEDEANTAVSLLKKLKFVNSVDRSKVQVGGAVGAVLPLKAIYSEGKVSFEGTRPSPEALDALLKASKIGLGDANVSAEFAEPTGTGGSTDAYSQFGGIIGRFSALQVRSAIVDVTDLDTTISGRMATEAGKAEIISSLGLSSRRTVIDNLETEGDTPIVTTVAAGTPVSSTIAGATTVVASTLTPEARTALQNEVNATLKSNRIEFATDSAVISQSSLATIADLADVLKLSGVGFEVGGHTDSRGRAERNVALSQSRADAVRAEFIKQGIAAEKITAKGYGSQKTIAPDNNSRGNPLNRRIEITLQ